MERSILSIAIVLLLCSYYLTPSSGIDYKIPKKESKAVHCSVYYETQQGKMGYTGFKTEQARINYLPNKFGDAHSPFQNAAIPLNPYYFKDNNNNNR